MRECAARLRLADAAAKVARGKEVYAVSCAACHGANREGQANWRSRKQDGRMPAPPHDDSGHTWHHPDEILFGITRESLVPGKYGPPARKCCAIDVVEGVKMKTSKFLAFALLVLAAAGVAAEPLPEVVMHKDPNCGCCGKWAEHLQAAGFRVKTVNETDMQRVKQQLGVPEKLGSCHTAQVGGYLIEGHVPASSIKRLLREKTAVRGLAAPGMPPSSPGMDVPGNKEPFDVIAFDRAGKATVYERIR